jgi:hypothetical protein
MRPEITHSLVKITEELADILSIELREGNRRLLETIAQSRLL